MNFRFSVNGAGRKALARAIGEIVGEDAVYNGAPSFAYTIGSFVIDRAGNLDCPADTSQEELGQLIAALEERGYVAETEDGSQQGDVPRPDVDDSNKLVIEMPLDGFTDKAIENLGEIVASKNRLIKKALGADSLRIDSTDDKLIFPWFTLTGTEGEMDAYSRFIVALCEMAKNQKRVTAKEKPSENDKFAMRIFLIRLGFNGPELKTARKILMRNLEGNTAWKNGKPENTEVASDVE